MYLTQGMYNSSKAAFMSASETWRMELAPLGVRTITLMTGGVKTKFFDNYIQRQVPETSYYIGAKDAIQKMGDGSLQDSGVDRYAYASKVVQAVERKESGKLWVGGGAVPAKWALWLLPQWGVVSILLLLVAEYLLSIDNVLTALIGFDDEKNVSCVQNNRRWTEERRLEL